MAETKQSDCRFSRNNDCRTGLLIMAAVDRTLTLKAVLPNTLENDWGEV